VPSGNITFYKLKTGECFQNVNMQPKKTMQYMASTVTAEGPTVQEEGTDLKLKVMIKAQCQYKYRQRQLRRKSSTADSFSTTTCTPDNGQLSSNIQRFIIKLVRGVNINRSCTKGAKVK
jgi:hypothetical protein